MWPGVHCTSLILWVWWMQSCEATKYSLLCVQRIASWLSFAKCKIEMQLIRQCSKLTLFANTVSEICGRITMLVYYIVDLAYQVHFYFAFCK